jgi:hypothetical protein
VAESASQPPTAADPRDTTKQEEMKERADAHLERPEEVDLQHAPEAPEQRAHLVLAGAAQHLGEKQLQGRGGLAGGGVEGAVRGRRLS